MDITPSEIGATVDVTDDAAHMLNRLADAYHENPDRVIELLGQLANARADLSANRDLDQPDWKNDSKAEAAEREAEEVLAAIVKLLNEEDRVTVKLLSEGCRKYAAELWAAADQSVSAQLARERGDVLRRFPGQRSAGQDAA